MQIGFIDYSSEERNKILSTLSLLNEPTAVDELGVGPLRDIYADLLFPGISTLQTRAKYFVLIPYLFQHSVRKIRSGEITNGPSLLHQLEQDQDQLVKTLMKNSPPDALGIIGSRAAKQHKTVAQKPSTSYWSGLRTFGIVHGGPNLSLSAACSLFVQQTLQRSEAELKLDGETYDDATAANIGTALFSPLPAPKGFMTEASVTLSRAEAEFIRTHILSSPSTQGSLLAFLLKSHCIPSDFDEIDTADMPSELARIYTLAQKFSHFIYGAHLRYNMIFSEGHDSEIALRFEAWLSELQYTQFDLDSILDPPLTAGHQPCSYSFSGFCRSFYESAQEKDFDRMDSIIINREVQIKGSRAKLNKPEEYCYQGAVHNYLLNYRFPRVQMILQDIFDGLEG